MSRPDTYSFFALLCFVYCLSIFQNLQPLVDCLVIALAAAVILWYLTPEYSTAFPLEVVLSATILALYLTSLNLPVSLVPIGGNSRTIFRRFLFSIKTSLKGILSASMWKLTADRFRPVSISICWIGCERLTRKTYFALNIHLQMILSLVGTHPPMGIGVAQCFSSTSQKGNWSNYRHWNQIAQAFFLDPRHSWRRPLFSEAECSKLTEGLWGHGLGGPQVWLGCPTIPQSLMSANG